MPHLRSVRLGFAVAIFAPCAIHAQVFLRAAEHGQGVLRARGGECFVVTPQHVVGEVTAIGVLGAHRQQGSATVEALYPGDIALLRMDPSRPIPCGDVWDAALRLSDRLATAVEGVLESRNEDGSLQRRFVRITSHDPRFITVRPIASGDEIFRGLSGSLLRIGGTPAGMLLAVNVERGEGVVLREDHLTDLVRSFFDAPAVVTAASVTGYTVDPDDYRAVVAERVAVRSSPDQRATSVGVIDVGSVVRVVGRVKERLWLRVAISDGRTGFVPSHALKRM